jgi:hypothetical protein
MEQEDGAKVSIAYLRFAEDEVRDKSPLYCELLRCAASDPEVIGFLLTLPRKAATEPVSCRHPTPIRHTCRLGSVAKPRVAGQGRPTSRDAGAFDADK